VFFELIKEEKPLIDVKKGNTRAKKVTSARGSYGAKAKWSIKGVG